MGNPVVHFEIMTKDGPAAQKWYADLFGWSIDANNPMGYGVVNTQANDTGIGGGIMSTTDGMPAMLTIYIAFDDRQAYLDKVTSMGGKTVVPVTVIPHMVTFAVFSDPQGNQVGIVKE